jgi:hypothetical protein
VSNLKNKLDMKNTKLIQCLLANVFLLFFAAFSVQVSAQTTPVSVFNYPGLNGGGGCSTENDNLIGIIGAIPGYTVDGSINSFSNSATLETQLNASTFFFMTDMETQDPANLGFLPVASRDVIKTWVNSGGVIVMTGTAGSRDTSFLNLIFSWDLNSVGGSSWAKNTGNTVGTPFEGVNEATLPAPSATDAIVRNSVPNFTTMWGTDSSATVAVIKYGAGSVIFMGYDFFNAGPSCGNYSSPWVQLIIPAALKYAKQLSTGAMQNITYSSAEYTATSSVAATGYWVAIAKGAIAPTVDQIKAGVDYNGVTVVNFGSGSIPAKTSAVFDVSGLQSATAYDFYFVSNYIDPVTSSPTDSTIFLASFTTLNYVPTITAIAGQSACPGTSVSNIEFTIDDAETPAGGLTLSATSSNSRLLPVSNIVFGGSNALRTVSLTPIVGQLGTSNVVVTVDDGQGGTAISTFIFTVEDETLPVVFTKSITVQLDATGNVSILSADVNNGSTDNCGIATLILDKTSFTCGNVGANTVTLKVTDVNGNVATQTAIVTVEDKVAPEVITKSITVQLDATGNVSILAADVNNGSSDACGIATLILDKTLFTCGNVGVNTVTLTVTDNNGNVATQTAIVTVEDQVAPVVLAKSITVQLDATGNVSILAADVNNGSSDACGISLLELNKTSFTCANVGANTVTLKVTDVNGNVATQTAIVTVEDKVAPEVVTKSITVQLDATGNVSILAADVNNGSTDACGIATLILDKTSFTCGNVGVNTVTLTVTDNNGNVATQTAIVTVEDKVAPEVITKSIIVQLDATGNVSILAADVNNGSADACGISSLELNKTSFTCANVGANTVTLKVTDVNGNVATQTAIVTVEDKVAPEVVTKSITVQLDATGNVSILAADVNNGSTDACGIATLILDKTSFTCGNVGVNTVTLTVTDNNGNVATQTAIVTVEDKVAPEVITKSIIVQLDATGNVSILAADVNNGSADACGISSLELNKTSFTCANVGANTVTLKVTDVNGNVATQTAIVTVEDKVAPEVVTKSITVQLDATGNVSILAADVNNGSTDACGIATLILDKTSFTCGNVGVNTVTLTVTDNNGNVATQTAIVTVEDKVAPEVITKSIIVQLDATGNVSILAADVNNRSTDNCGISLIELDKALFTCANVGVNTVTLKVTDVNGNVATQTAIITVEDKIAPVVVTKNITVQLDASSNVTIAAADVNNGSTDICGISLLELDRATFSCANVGDNTVTLKVTDNSGNVSTQTAIVTVVNSQPNLIRKHFDDVIFFDNSSNAFIGYTWYKNGLLVSDQTAQYFKDDGVLNGAYYAIATKVDGTVFTTCPLTFSASVEVEYLMIAPNPVRSNSVYQLITNVDSARLQNARVTVFNILGILITDRVIDKNAVEMVAPTTEGIYIVKMTLENGKYFTKNLLVKN